MLSSMTEEQETIRAAVRRFAEAEIAPVSEALWEEQLFPYEIWRKVCELGFTGLPYPEAYGGGGAIGFPSPSCWRSWRASTAPWPTP